jgi:hypothetical protein
MIEFSVNAAKLPSFDNAILSGLLIFSMSVTRIGSVPFCACTNFKMTVNKNKKHIFLMR